MAEWAAYFLPDDLSPPPPTRSGPILAERLNSAFAGLDPVERLRLLARQVPGPLVVTTSFGLEDQALTQLVVDSGIPATFATLDTGRLFPEVYDVWAATEAYFALRIRAVYPDAATLETLVGTQGIDGFRSSVAARHECCAVRKVQPLGRALDGATGWITGLRADQSGHRAGQRFVSHDAQRGLLKANPLLDWTREAVAELVASRGVPANPLHAQGYLSIGCAPCTRATAPGEDERAGRWWWEADSARECGLHLDKSGRLMRGAAAP